jgi:hypothetical protein
MTYANNHYKLVLHSLDEAEREGYSKVNLSCVIGIMEATGCTIEQIKHVQKIIDEWEDE